MVGRLVQAGWEVHAWNRSPEKAEQLRAKIPNLRVHNQPQQAVAGCAYTITMLEDGAAVRSVLFGQTSAVANSVAATAAHIPGHTIIDMSSILPEQAQDHAQRLAAMGVAHIDAPVSGGTLGAEAGNLAIMAGGNPQHIAHIAALMAPLGTLTHVGPIGSGQLAKLANQMIVGITIGAVAEALLLCEQGGADSALVRQAIMGGFAQSRVLEVHGQRMVERDFAARGRLAIQLKDMRNVLHTSQRLGTSVPISSLLERLYTEGVAQGLADLDQAALFLSLQAMQNGGEGAKKKSEIIPTNQA